MSAAHPRRKAFLTAILRSIRGSLGRFLAIVGIVALGCGFYAGLQMCGPVMRRAADELYDGTSLYDLRLVCTMGFSADDVDRVKGLVGTDDVMAALSCDVMAALGDERVAIRVSSLDVSAAESGQEQGANAILSSDGTYLNRVFLREGRWPRGDAECVISADAGAAGVGIGDPVEALYGTTDLDDVLRGRRLVVVGKVSSSNYPYTGSFGSTTLGSGKIADYAYVSPEAFAEDAPFTEIYVRVHGAESHESGSDAYQAAVDEVGDRLEAQAGRLARSRLADVRADAQEELDENRADFERERDDAYAELADARAELDDALGRINEGEAEYSDGMARYQEGKDELARQRSDALAALDDAQAQINDSWAQVAGRRDELQQGRQRVVDGRAQLEAGKAELLARLGAGSLSDARASLEGQRSQVQAGIDALEEAQGQVQAGIDALEQAIAAGAQVPGDLSGDLSEAVPDGVPEDTVPEALPEGMAQDEADGELPADLAGIEGGEGQPADPGQQLAGLQQQLGSIEGQLDEARAALAQVDEGLAGVLELESRTAELEAAEAEVASGASQLEQGERDLVAGQAELDARRAQAMAELEAGEAELDRARDELDDARRELDEAWEAYEDGLREYEDGRRDAESTIADAQRQLDDAQADLDELEVPDVFVLDRGQNEGVLTYDADSRRMDSIADVFPLMFFLVAALVALTTMTRMVDDDRIEMGTYKALGYSNAQIAGKYLAYAGLASATGAVLGVLALSQVLPIVVTSSYAIIYTVPLHPFPLPIDLGIALASGGVGVGITLLATWAAVVASLREVPAALMLPRAPAAGKRILLERVGPLWRRLSFSWKVTFRNLFRYKRRLSMTVIGISGCTALLLTGFGLHDAIWDIIDGQYGPLIHYDTTIGLDDDATSLDVERVARLLSESGDASDVLRVQHENMRAGTAGEDETLRVEVVIPRSEPELAHAVTLRDRVTHDVIPFGDDAVVVTEKIALKYGVAPGDEVVLYDQDAIGNVSGSGHALRVTGVAENYVGNLVYVGRGAWRDVDDVAPPFSTFLLNVSTDPAKRQAFADSLQDAEGVSTITFSDETIDMYRNMLSVVDLVVVVLIVSAGALAFIVLYNLTNINIGERIREIASLKVLGFTRGEVYAYVFREIGLLAALGDLLGLALGTLLASFVITTAEVDYVMFGRSIHPPSYVWAFALTLAFTGLILLFMRRKLDGVGMVESLKSVE